MLRMKDDMSGAAAVLGIMRALPALKPKVEVHGLIAATENMPSGTAFRPATCCAAMNGTTIEIGNTDAEGRLTLADVLCYAVQTIKPDEMVDMATLDRRLRGGAGPALLGPDVANDQALANRLLSAAEAAGERVWQLPLLDEYREHLKIRRGRPEQRRPARRRRDHRRALPEGVRGGRFPGPTSTSPGPRSSRRTRP